MQESKQDILAESCVLTLKATRIGTFAALCMGVALSGMAAITLELGLVGTYKSDLGSSIYNMTHLKELHALVHSCASFPADNTTEQPAGIARKALIFQYATHIHFS